MENNLTWQEAKKSTQEMELEIADLIPDESIVRVEQKKDGTLFSCGSEGQHLWKGSTTIDLVEGTEVESIVRNIQEYYDKSRFEIQTGSSHLSV